MKKLDSNPKEESIQANDKMLIQKDYAFSQENIGIKQKDMEIDILQKSRADINNILREKELRIVEMEKELWDKEQKIREKDLEMEVFKMNEQHKRGKEEDEERIVNEGNEELEMKIEELRVLNLEKDEILKQRTLEIDEMNNHIHENECLLKDYEEKNSLLIQRDQEKDQLMKEMEIKFEILEKNAQNNENDEKNEDNFQGNLQELIDSKIEMERLKIAEQEKDHIIDEKNSLIETFKIKLDENEEKIIGFEIKLKENEELIFEKMSEIEGLKLEIRNFENIGNELSEKQYLELALNEKDEEIYKLKEKEYEQENLLKEKIIELDLLHKEHADLIELMKEKEHRIEDLLKVETEVIVEDNRHRVEAFKKGSKKNEDNFKEYIDEIDKLKNEKEILEQQCTNIETEWNEK